MHPSAHPFRYEVRSDVDNGRIQPDLHSIPDAVPGRQTTNQTLAFHVRMQICVGLRWT